MGVKDSFTGAPLFMKIVFIVLLLAQICNWVAFTTAEWGKTYATVNTNIFSGTGLWRICSNTDPLKPCSAVDGTRNEWFSATQAFAIFGFIGINVAFLIVVLQLFTQKCKSLSDINIVNAVLCFVTAACYLIAVVIFAVRFDETYGPDWSKEFGMSFALAIVSLVLEVVAGVLIIMDNKKGGGTSPIQYAVSMAFFLVRTFSIVVLFKNVALLYSAID